MEEQSACIAPMAAVTFGDSGASDGGTSLSAATVHAAKVERWRARAALTVAEALGVGTPRQRARTVAAFSTMNIDDRPSSFSSGAIGSVAPLVDTSSCTK